MSPRPPYHPIVKPTSHPLWYEVESEHQRGLMHFVDLGALHFNGSCTCPHFAFGLEKLLTKQGHAASDRTRCKHIRAARIFFCNTMIRAVTQDIARTAPQLNQQQQ